MSFIKLNYLPFIILSIVIFSFITLVVDKKYFSWIKEYFFYKKSRWAKVGTLLYLLFFILMGVSLLDLRGEIESVEGKVSEQRTLILIDASASMLAEDVRPNRFQKAIVLARHFVKNAHGHKISIVLFSDIQKRIVPFTDDIDLLDARLAGLNNLYNLKGGSNILKAISEATQYFIVDDKDETNVGNLLIFTDTEETIAGVKLRVPENISVAAVAVGTKKGANIPVKTSKGVFLRYKKFAGKEVVTKLDENFLKKLGESITNYKYWVVQSFNLPTEEILNFYRGKFLTNLQKSNMKVRPVKGYFIILLAIFTYILYTLVYHFNSFTLVISALIVMSSFGIMPAHAQANSHKLVNKNPEDLKEKAQEEANILIDKYRKSSLTKEERLHLAFLLSKLGDHKRSKIIFDENTPPNIQDIDNKTLYNRATNELALNNYSNAVEQFSQLQKRLKSSNGPRDKEVLEKVNENILHAMKLQKKNKSKKGKKGEDKENKDKSKKNEEGKGGDKSDKKDKSEGKDKKDKKDDKEKKDKNGEKEQPKDNKEALKDLENKIKQQRKQVKIPGTIKQLMDNDRDLQQKYIDTSTNKRNLKKSKDW